MFFYYVKKLAKPESSYNAHRLPVIMHKLKNK